MLRTTGVALISVYLQIIREAQSSFYIFSSRKRAKKGSGHDPERARGRYVEL